MIPTIGQSTPPVDIHAGDRRRTSGLLRRGRSWTSLSSQGALWVANVFVTALALLSSTTPTEAIQGEDGFTAVNATAGLSLGGDQTCAIRANHSSLWCWGSNEYGQLGVGNTSDQHIPVQVHGMGEGPVSMVTAGWWHTCAIRASDMSLSCWGNNDWGQLGTGSASDRHSPTRVHGIGGGPVLVVTAGEGHTCAIRSNDSSLWCWGSNSFGQLGIGNAGDQHEPVRVHGIGEGPVSMVAAGASHTCAIRTSDDSLWCWGANFEGQLGDGGSSNRRTPVLVHGMGRGPVSAIGTGSMHTCAVWASDDSLWCWGSNSWGELGNNSTVMERAPIAVHGIIGKGPVSVVSSGCENYKSCAIRANDSSLWCWGNNYYGQLGNNHTSSSELTPVEVYGIGKGPISVASPGRGSTCAIVATDGSLWCWGRNKSGQLGVGTTTDHSTPVRVGRNGGGGDDDDDGSRDDDDDGGGSSGDDDDDDDDDDGGSGSESDDDNDDGGGGSSDDDDDDNGDDDTGDGAWGWQRWAELAGGVVAAAAIVAVAVVLYRRRFHSRGASTPTQEDKHDSLRVPLNQDVA